jgi:hypothetical protein
MKKVYINLIYFTLCFFLAGCGLKLWGTEGTNPQNNHAGAGTLYSSEVLRDTICKKRALCRNQNDTLCPQNVSENPQITNELLLNPPYSNLSEVIVAEEANLIQISPLDMNECLSAITNIDCGSTLAQSAFSDSYSDIYLILESSSACARALTIK